MKTAFTFIFSIFLIGITIGQRGSLIGSVTDESGEAIVLANVVLTQEGDLVLKSLTELNGTYKFIDIKPGKYELTVQYTGYVIKTINDIKIEIDKTSTLDVVLSEGVSPDEVIVTDIHPRKTTKKTVTTYKEESFPSKPINGIATSPSRAKSSPDSYTAYATSSTYAERESLPSSGQMTAGEWNDLHNWKDWMELLENEDYSIMTERFEIFPLERYSVLVVNEDNNVIPNVPAQLISKNGDILWETITDNAGKAELWLNAFNKGEEAKHILIDGKKISDIRTIDKGSNTVTLRQDCYSPEKMDIVFTVDATSSMSDEINYLKSELLDVISRIKETNEDISYQTGSVFYRDMNDTYLTRVSPLSEDEDDINEFVKDQDASGGGDHPEAVEEALEKTLALDWRKDALKIVFLILDAPPHEDDATMEKIKTQIRTAAEKGIKLIPITASGIGRETEFLMKFMAMMTNGTYVFITDDSGIGNAHLDPVVKDYEVEKLNDCIVRLITQYGKSYSCDADIRSTSDVDIKIYPNPSTQFINVSTNVIPDKIKVLSANGMMVKSIKPSDKNTRIEMDDLVNGVYTVAIYIDDKVESRQVILLK